MKKIINKYRVYALIHGQTLPIGRLFDCMIKPMSLRTQKRRKFEPIKSDDVLDAYTEHKSFVSNIPYIDPKILKSEYVVITEAI